MTSQLRKWHSHFRIWILLFVSVLFSIEALSISTNAINFDQNDHSVTIETYIYNKLKSSDHVEVGHIGRLSRVLSIKEVRPDHEVLADVTSVAAKTSANALKIRPDMVLSGGRSGLLVKNLTGPANSVLKGGGNRIFITDDAGKAIWDITMDRAKSVIPGKGFGPPAGADL